MIKRKHLFYGFAILGLMALLYVCRSRIEPSLHRFIDHYQPSEQLQQIEHKIKTIKSFDFNSDGDSEGWEQSPGTIKCEVKNGCLVLISTQNIPFITINTDFSASSVTAIKISMKIFSETPVKLLWATFLWASDKEGTISSINRSMFNALADNKFHTYYVYVEDSPNWMETITRLRFAPADELCTVEIDYIDLLNIPFIKRMQMEGFQSGLIKAFIRGEFRNAIYAPPPSEIEQIVRIPQKPLLDFGYGVLPAAWNKEGKGVQFYIQAIDEKGKTHILFSNYIDPKHKEKDRCWFNGRIDLSQFTGQNLRLILGTRNSYLKEEPSGRKPDERYDYAVWSNPEVYSNIKGKDDVSIILISLDALRKDHLGCYGYSRDTSPNIDKIAAQGILFQNAISQSSWTLPSHASLLTSKYPSFHGAITSLDKLSSENITLSEILREKGYTTICFTETGWLNPAFGLDQGFDVFNSTSGDIKDRVEAVHNWFEWNKHRKFFIFFHTYAIHDYFHNKGEYIQPYASELQKGVEEGVKIIDLIRERDKRIYQSFYQNYINDIYDGAIKCTDKYLGELFDAFEASLGSKGYLLILTSDHGEEFGEHGHFHHGMTLYDEMINVPIIIKIPNSHYTQKIINEQVQLIDIPPTIFDLIDEPIPEFFQGNSLLPIVKGGSNSERQQIAFSEIDNEGYQLICLRTNEYKYIYNIASPRKNPSIEELYDLIKDKGETYNLKDVKPEIHSSLRELTKRFLLNSVSGYIMNFVSDMNSHLFSGSVVTYANYNEIKSYYTENDDLISINKENSRLDFKINVGSKDKEDIIVFEVLPEEIEIYLYIELDGNILSPERLYLGKSGQQSISMPLLIDKKILASSTYTDDYPDIDVKKAPLILFYRHEAKIHKTHRAIIDEQTRKRLKALGYLK
ncbi:MAG: sulfatase [Acidobacteriota bacterium]